MLNPTQPKKTLSSNTEVSHSWKRAVNGCNLKDVPYTLRRLLATSAWRERYECSQIWRFDYLYDYITTKSPRGCGWEPEVVEALLEKAGDAEALEMFRKEMRGKEGREADAEDRTAKEQQPHGGARRKGESKLYANNSDVQLEAAPTGNSRDAFLRRLRKDRPDIHARVLAGELSPHAGMVEAGFRKKIERRKTTPLERVLKLLPKLSPAEREAVHQATAPTAGARLNT
jgi:hypothetical protein